MTRLTSQTHTMHHYELTKAELMRLPILNQVLPFPFIYWQSGHPLFASKYKNLWSYDLTAKLFYFNLQYQDPLKFFFLRTLLCFSKSWNYVRQVQIVVERCNWPW